MTTSQHVADAGKTLIVGGAGTGASVFLQNFNQLAAGLAAVATLIYVCLKIYDWWKYRHRRDRREDDPPEI